MLKPFQEVQKTIEGAENEVQKTIELLKKKSVMSGSADSGGAGDPVEELVQWAKTQTWPGSGDRVDPLEVLGLAAAVGAGSAGGAGGAGSGDHHEVAAVGAGSKDRGDDGSDDVLVVIKPSKSARLA